MEKENRIKELVVYLNYATKMYDEGNPIISDQEWDDVYFELKRLEDTVGIILPNSPTQTINYEVVTALNKVQHNHKMLSLAKTKDWDEFLEYFGAKDVIGMVKLDGLTCSLMYQDGKLISAETRGNGLVGEDILHNAKVISSIPKQIPYKEDLVVDGEIICTNSDFKEFAEEYANSRNFASGSIRLLDSSECAKRKLTFVVWNIVSGLESENSFMERLTQVEDFGFTVVPWVSSFDWDAKDFLVKQATKLGYPIDGLVGRFDDIAFGTSLGETDHHARAAYAFKFYDETYSSTLKTIEWTMGRTGILTPVAVFDPIEIEGSVVERASLHNYSIMTQLMGKPYVGQKIEVFKANMIIPQIADSDQADPSEERDWISIPQICPICGHNVEIVTSETGIENVVCVNPNCEGKLINRLDHFCGKKGLDIKGLSKATLEKLINWGWVNNLSDIFELKNHKDEWMRQSGFGERSVQNILNAIEAAKSPTLDKFISSLGIPLIGNTVSKELIKHIKTYEEFR
ncbi:MAG: NAD-dependent DNA ligase LigA, partial [Bacilli bacterium]|nr:NAD-dependent DNA ligase LigA [Bacilli bacterium]